MGKTGRRWQSGICWLLIAGGGGGLCLPTAVGQERVKISGGNPKGPYPQSIQQRRDWEKLLKGMPELKSPDSRGPNTPPMPLPNNLPGEWRSKRLQELYDQKRNWIFVTPEMLNEQLTTEQALGVREYKPDEPGGPSGSKVMDRYFKSLQYDKSNPNRNAKASRSSKDEEFSKNGNTTNDKPEFRMDRPAYSLQSTGSVMALPKTMEFAPNNLSISNSIPGLMGFTGVSKPEAGFVHPGFSEPSFSEILRNAAGGRETPSSFGAQSARDFNQILRPGRPSLLLGGPNDPVNLVPDPTRNAVHPVVPSGLDALEPFKATREPFSQASRLAPPSRNRFFEELNQRVFGPSSLPVALNQDRPPALPIPEPGPGMLVMPKRAF